MSFKSVFRKFAVEGELGGQYKRIFWNSWQDQDEVVGVDYCYGFLEPSKVTSFIEAANENSPDSNRLLLADEGQLFSCEKRSFQLDMEVSSFMEFQKDTFLRSDLASSLFIYDDSEQWIIHVDEVVLFVGEDSIVEALVSKLGGGEVVIQSMLADIEACSGYAKEWRRSHLEFFIENS